MLNQERKITNGIRIAAILFSMIFSLVFWQEQSITVFAQGTAKVTAESGKIREKATTDSTVLASVKKDDTLEVTASTTDSNGYTWYKVFVDKNSQGYIRGDLVSAEGKIPAEKTADSTVAAASTSTGNTSDSSGGNVTTVGSGGNVTTVGGGSSTTTTTSPQEPVAVNTAQTPISPSQVVRAKTTETVRVRKGAGTSYEVAGNAAAAVEVSVAGEAVDGEGKLWYQISYNQGNQTINGFIREDFLEVLETAAPEIEEETTVIEEEPETTVVNEDFYLKYMENEAGEWDWFLFDQVQGTSQSLTQLLAAVDQIEANAQTESNQNSTMKIIIIVMAVVLVLLVVAVTVLLFKLRDSYEDYEDYEDEEEEEEDDEIDEIDEGEEEDELPARGLKARMGLKREKPVINENREKTSSEWKEKPTASSEETKTWQSKDFLELDDDMEFEFLDL